MASLPPSDTELLTEHFGYPPVSLLDDIINSINILAERALNSVEQGLLNAPPASLGFRPPKSSSSSSRSHNAPPPPTQQQLADQHKHEIENGTHQLETLLCASIDKNFDLFELYVMRNILCVRPDDRDWIRLAHYDGLDFSAAATGPDAPTVESVTALRRKLQASQRLNVLLEAEKARNDALLAKVRALTGGPGAGKRPEEDGSRGAGATAPPPLAFLHHREKITDADAEKPIATTTAFTLSQLQALRALSTSLRTVLPDLGSPDAGEESGLDGKKSWRRDRLEYVEASTRKYLENARGLELGQSGAVRDGEWQGEGRGLAQGEVEGLEKVVTLLGANSASGGTSEAGRADEMDES